MRYRAVLFDAGETLVHPTPSFAELFADVLTGRGHPCEPADVLEASALVFVRFDEAARDREGWTTSPERSAWFWKGVYRRMLGVLGLTDRDGLPEVLYETFTDLRNYALFDDVVPMLDDLAPTGIDLGIVSNFEPWLEDLLGHLGVRDRFPVRAISGVEGVEKPDPALFERAIDRLGHPVASVAYVGDNPAFDVAPAAAVGMTPILIDRRGRFPDHEGRRIDDLRALRATLEAA